MDLNLLKGTKEYLPSEQIIRERILAVLRDAFERYGFSPLETPIINTFELLASKYAGGSEILKETYQLTDQGQRTLGLRYDLTVPCSRIIGYFCGLHNDLPLPVKRYEIGKVFRDGPVRSGRVREFTQCDVDVIGVADVLAEAELIALAGEVFDQLELPVVVRVNHRKVLSAILRSAGVPEQNLGEAILSVDKLEKIGWEGVCKELQEKGLEQPALDSLDEIFQLAGSPEEIIGQLKDRLVEEKAQKALEELERLLELLPAAGFTGRLKLVPSLARGLEIYTGIVFECFLVDQRRIASSLAAGGRYDEIIGRFLEAEDPTAYPAAGISFGLDVLFEALKQQKVEEQKTVTQVYVIPIGVHKEALEIATRLRREGLKVDVAAPGRRIKKLFRYANQMDIPFVVTLGENELEAGVVNLKNMREESESQVTVEQAIGQVKKALG